MPNTCVPAAGEAMPAAFLGRFSGRVIIGEIADQMAEASRQIDRDIASIVAAMKAIHGDSEYYVFINHELPFVFIGQRSPS